MVFYLHRDFSSKAYGKLDLELWKMFNIFIRNNVLMIETMDNRTFFQIFYKKR